MSANEKEITQWVSSIVNVESKSEDNLRYLKSVLGPIKNDLYVYLPEDEGTNIENELTEMITDEINQQVQNDLKGVFMHEIVFKIDEKLFIEKINIYEKVCPGSSLLKIEALESENNWFLLWETDRPLDVSKPKIFTPDIKPTPFRTDTVRFTVCGSIYLIDGIEIKGNKIGVQISETKKHNVSLLSRNLETLIENELFADVYFEVEGKIIPAHRNILVSRSEYFRAMLSTHGHFKESQTSKDPSKNPIYIKELEYDIFIQVIKFLYTGHVDIEDNNKSRNLLIAVMKAADKLNLIELGKVCLFHLFETMDEKNVVKIFKEACETPEIMGDVLKLCYDVMSDNFQMVSRSEDFCSIEQEQMVMLIQNIIPKLNRVTSSIIDGEQHSPILISSSSNIYYNENNLLNDENYQIY